MTTAVVLFTRDLRVHDQPALARAVDEADRVVPLFVLDDAILSSPIASPNKLAFLLDSVDDLTSSLRDIGGKLVKRHGDLVEEVGKVCADVNAGLLLVGDDVSRYATRRTERLRESLDGVEVQTVATTTVQPPGVVTTTSGDPYARFTPYWRSWDDTPMRRVLDVPTDLSVPTTINVGGLPSIDELVDAERSPELPRGGEARGREVLTGWLDGPIHDYDDTHDDLADQRTSGLSPYLHLGCVSPVEICHRVQRSSEGAKAFVRQVCWRDYHHQVLASDQGAAWRDHQDRGDRWRTDEEELETWKQGRTGYPIVDAGMRQLQREGWMHNRARLVTASFLVRDLYIDWREGARHFLRWLVDGDLANNQMNWQWVAGTGTHSRPNQVMNPQRQAERFDPDGEYVRRYVPELAHIPGGAVHTPWELDEAERGDIGDYPRPMIDHYDALARFKRARGID